MNKTYFEVVVEGHHELIRGFALGFLAARGIEGEAAFAREHHVKGSGKLHQLMRILSVTEDQTRIIIGEEIGRALKEAYEKRQSELAVKVVSIRQVVGARFRFRFKTFSKEFGEKLKATFADLPPGVQIGGYKPEEVIHPEGKGVEAYAPLHAYEIKASGEVSGPAKEVIDFYDRIEHNELIELEEIRLEFS